MEDHDVFTLNEVAERLKVNLRTIQRAVKDGRLIAFYIGDSPRVSGLRLKEYMSQQERKERD